MVRKLEKYELDLQFEFTYIITYAITCVIAYIVTYFIAYVVTYVIAYVRKYPHARTVNFLRIYFEVNCEMQFRRYFEWHSRMHVRI